MDGKNLLHRLVDIILNRRAMKHDIHGECSTGDEEFWRSTIKVREALRVHSSRCDDQLQVSSAGQDVLEKSHEHISVESALVGLVHDDTRIPVQIWLIERLAQQDTVCHILDNRLLARAILETDRIPNRAAKLAFHLLAHTLCHTHRCHTTWLGAPDHPPLPIPILVKELRQLGRFTRPRLSHNDNNLVIPNNPQQILPHRKCRQILLLLPQRLTLTEITRPLTLLRHMLRKLAIPPPPLLPRRRRRTIPLILLNPHQIPQRRARHIRRLLRLLLPLLLLSPLLHHPTPLPAKHRHIALIIPNRRHRIHLLRKHRPPIQKRRAQIVNQQMHTRLLFIILEIVAEVPTLRYARRQHPIRLPGVNIPLLLRRARRNPLRGLLLHQRRLLLSVLPRGIVRAEGIVHFVAKHMSALVAGVPVAVESIRVLDVDCGFGAIEPMLLRRTGVLGLSAWC
ncbi:hypothetical protein VC83_07976 [Pseudogymnoascus destructans]|uniref:Uncharacterized protein n=1 Tax=Pseudogymnoascus destructans TaxID=655981 RepID=A0A177A1G8_9PEZI|nr:uncharacterized protein VC83_07976 [Pseudogymnoascus destructans]OAF56016.1 hypothetical protein VC83_07976 [Pseudogymnoascus destructans]